MVDDIDVVWRDFNSINVPSSGEYEPEKARIRALLKKLRDSGGQSVTRNTLGALLAVTPPSEDYMGIVLSGTGAGYYYRSAGTWEFGRRFPDTLARLGSVAGSANAVTAIVTPAVDPAQVILYLIEPVLTNSGAVTLSINGGAPRPVLDVNGQPLTSGLWQAGRLISLIDATTSYRMTSDPDADGAAAAAAASAALAAASAATAATYTFAEFATVAAMIADNTQFGYTGSGASIIVSAGYIMRAAGFRYTVAASGATDHALTTAKGVKLYVQSDNVLAYGAPTDGVSSMSAAFQIAVNNAPKIPSPYGDMRVVRVPAGRYIITSAMEVTDHFILLLENCSIKLADESYDCMIRNKNARAMRAPTGLAADTRDDGIRSAVTSNATYSYTPGSGLTVVADGSIVTINGFRYRVMASGFTATPLVNVNGVKFAPDRDDRIYVKGIGKVTLDGNGMNNWAAGSSGAISHALYRRNGVNFGFATNYEIDNITIVNTARWGMSNEHARWFKITNITLEQPGWSGRTIQPGASNWKSQNGLPNQDGINIRCGCYDWDIDGVFGRTGDDCIAVTNLYPSNDPAEERTNHYSSTWAPYGKDVMRFAIRNVRAKAIGTHHTVRLLTSDDRVIQGFDISDVFDMTTLADVAGNEYSVTTRGAEAVVLIGDKKYGKKNGPATSIGYGSITNIHGLAYHIVQHKWSSSNIEFTNIGTTAVGLLNEGSAVNQNAVTYMDGLEQADYDDPGYVNTDAEFRCENHTYDGVTVKNSVPSGAAGQTTAFWIRTNVQINGLWINDITVRGCQNVMWIMGGPTGKGSYISGGIDGVSIRGTTDDPFKVDVGADTASMNFFIRNIVIRALTALSTVTAAGRFYTPRFYFKLDDSGPRVRAVDTIPQSYAGSGPIAFDSGVNGFSVLTLAVSTASAWVKLGDYYDI